MLPFSSGKGSGGDGVGTGADLDGAVSGGRRGRIS
jgi:hypothetical protein